MSCKKTLIELLKECIVCIPAIQREYVQGYDEEEINEIRQNLLNDIFKVLKSENDDELPLNIIYGYKESNEDKFYPIDGQQRLTTLYILHWFLWTIKTDNGQENFTKKTLAYEVRDSADSFFKVLNDEQDFFRSLINGSMILNKSTFRHRVIAQKWFESEWLSDPTVMAVINVIGELCERNIHREEAKKYYKKLENSYIYFDVLYLSNNNPMTKSSEEFAKINSRGKSLEIFENVKSMLNMLIETLDMNENFAQLYDTKFIDFFYNICNKERDLEEITKDINNKTMDFLINSYNLLKIILSDYRQEEQLKTHSDYSRLVYEEIDKLNSIEFDKDFWKKYFIFINNVLNVLTDMSTNIRLTNNSSEKDKFILEEFIKNFEEYFLNIQDFSNYEDNEKLIFSLLYLNYYNIAHSDRIINIKVFDKFYYILENLAYSKWSKSTDEFKIMTRLAEIIAINDDIFDYFIKNKVDNILEHLEKLTKEIKDIKTRAKEQKIKCCIIKENFLNYDYFRELEIRFQEKRSIFFLLYISKYISIPWENMDTKKGNIDLLRSYVEQAKSFFINESNIKLKKGFSIATYYDKNKNEMMNGDDINKLANSVYGSFTNEKGQLNDNEIVIESIKDDSFKAYEYDNLHKWKNEYYFVNDNITDTEFKLKKIKLDTLKLFFDLYINDSINNLKKQILEKKYTTCWLQYAINLEQTEILDSLIRFDNRKLYIVLDKKDQFYKYPYGSVNFFSYLYSLEKKKHGYIYNKFLGNEYDLRTRNVSDTKVKSEFVDFVNFDYFKNKLLINHFQLKLVCQDEKEKFIFDTRNFFYYKYKIEFMVDKDSLIEMNDYNIKKLTFTSTPEEYQEEDFTSDFKKIMEDIERYIEDEEDLSKTINELDKEYNIKKSELEILKQSVSHQKPKAGFEEYSEKIKEKEKEIIEIKRRYNEKLDDNYECTKSYDYKYKNKYIFKKSQFFYLK